ncbi:hypothetical protein QBC46DRAFT_459121 [Diplogelasinospora grovesii]|uniref:2EXR domain-containing protein n=1 Tax=Diplogelasinospora grovesii TaxID=303347 RepID=A0AAN6N841_9PEZI|nr:hypothetical protein QBC46DRAFT_459121 [Diplogelasinospora grovesii]
MDQSDATSHNDATIGNNATARLFNDVYFSRAAPPACDTWAPCPRLPVELRLQIWLLLLRRHRMIEVVVCADADDEGDTTYPGDAPDGSQPWYYTDRNHLGRIVSGRGYTLALDMAGRGYAASLNPLLWVNSEARQAALKFYRVHLPFPRQDGEQVLYLNPEHDVLYVRPAFGSRSAGDYRPRPRTATVLADFLHDVRAYDPKDQGVAHLALQTEYLRDFVYYDPRSDDRTPPLTPAILHPVAAASFADMLRSRLRSVLCVIGFRSRMRGMSEFPGLSWRYHFAQTFPLRRRGLPAGGFHWFETDPRWGVHLDLGQLPLDSDPRGLARGWEELEKAFGISERAEDDEFRFYICPTLRWGGLQRVGQTPPPEGSREELAQHLREEADDWLHGRKYISQMFSRSDYLMPRHGTMVDAKTFEMMESAPSTAVGMWLFPAEACFNVVAVHPGLFLFEV